MTCTKVNINCMHNNTKITSNNIISVVFTGVGQHQFYAVVMKRAFMWNYE